MGGRTRSGGQGGEGTRADGRMDRRAQWSDSDRPTRTTTLGCGDESDYHKTKATADRHECMPQNESKTEAEHIWLAIDQFKDIEAR